MSQCTNKLRAVPYQQRGFLFNLGLEAIQGASQARYRHRDLQLEDCRPSGLQWLGAGSQAVRRWVWLVLPFVHTDRTTLWSAHCLSTGWTTMQDTSSMETQSSVWLRRFASTFSSQLSNGFRAKRQDVEDSAGSNSLGNLGCSKPCSPAKWRYVVRPIVMQHVANLATANFLIWTYQFKELTLSKIHTAAW